MTTKLVLRVLDALGQMLGWTEVRALAKGDGALWATHPVSVLIERDGTPHELSIHWADIHVETRVPCRHDRTIPGAVLSLRTYESEPVLRLGTPPASLPQITVRATASAAPPTGGLGVRV